MTARQIELAKMSAEEYMAARAAGTVTCVEYAEVLTMRATYYKYMGQFMYWDNMPDQMSVVMAQAAALDAKASAAPGEAAGGAGAGDSGGAAEAGGAREPLRYEVVSGDRGADDFRPLSST